MKSKIFVLLVFFIFTKADVINNFKKQNYSSVCSFNNISVTKDENILSVIGISCVKSDKLYLLPYIIKKLKYTKIGRKNSIYLLTIYMQKKLLYSYFFDHLPLNGFALPKTDYILSVIFNKIKNNDYKKAGDIIIIKYKKKIIQVYPLKNKLFVDEYLNNNLIKRRWFK